MTNRRGRPRKPFDRKCPTCGGIIQNHLYKYCSTKCWHSNPEYISSKRKSREEFYNSPEGRAYRAKSAKRMNDINRKKDDVVMFSAEDYIVNVPNIDPLAGFENYPTDF